MQIETEHHDGRCAARVVGEMTIYAATELKASFRDMLAAAREIELDLVAVEEFDSAGLQLLLWLASEVEREHKALRVTRRSHAIEEVLTLLNLEAVLDAGAAPR